MSPPSHPGLPNSRLIVPPARRTVKARQVGLGRPAAHLCKTMVRRRRGEGRLCCPNPAAATWRFPPRLILGLYPWMACDGCLTHIRLWTGNNIPAHFREAVGLAEIDPSKDGAVAPEIQG